MYVYCSQPVLSSRIYLGLFEGYNCDMSAGGFNTQVTAASTITPLQNQENTSQCFEKQELTDRV